MIDTWRSLSVRASMLLSMALMLLPLLVSAVVGYLILNRTVIADYQDIAFRQHNQLVPLHNLQFGTVQAEMALEEYVITGNSEKLNDYHLLQQKLEEDFTYLSTQLDHDQELAQLSEVAKATWSGLDPILADLLAARAVQDQANIAASLSRFNSLQASTHDKLSSLYRLVETKLAQDYADADRGFERSEWVAGISIVISLLFMLLGISLIRRNLLSSIHRLVDGARIFSEGNRDHKIEVQVPPELKEVAQEFNRMIAIIQKSEDVLVEQANRDKLTNLLNRRTYDDTMLDAYQRLQRDGEPMALIALDIDHFKKINDTYGHEIGDSVLKEVAAVLLLSVRAVDKVFRTGGEEFSIVLPGADEIAAATTAERLRKAVERTDIQTAQGDIEVTISLGVAVGVNSSHTPDLLKKRADLSLYSAKAAGRNAVRIAGAEEEKGRQ